MSDQDRRVEDSMGGLLVLDDDTPIEMSSGEASPASAAAPVESPSVLEHLELPLEVRLGSLEWSLGKVLSLEAGARVPLGRGADDSVTLCVQGRPYARGELVLVGGRFAFRVREVLSKEALD